MATTIDFGIDLGTTNSSIALCRGGEVKVFQTTDLMNVMPSVVYISRNGRILVGRRAYDTWVADPENTQAEFKRWMGFTDRLTFPGSGKQMSAEELSAEVLKALRADAERQTAQSIAAAVITVPAAFGSLQCDATGRAAKLAGFEYSPLLQEPIAAAIAYGAAPASRDQRWMVFDLGGGTLDIAIVSTRDGRLAVMEHQGNNRLGGKDVDRAIAGKMISDPLATAFRLPTEDTDPAAHNRLQRAITRHAEQAKIALSTAGQTTVDLFDIGEDLDGKTIEMTLVLKRSEMERHVQPVVDRCIELVRRAITGARVSPADLDRVLLVGGPTQMPIFREALIAELGPKLDHSLDPMTAVSHGAALYASTLEHPDLPAASASSAAAAPTALGNAAVQLAYERASGTPTSPVAVLCDPATRIAEIKIDAAGGIWTSGWIPATAGCAQTEVLLTANKPVTKFLLSARDARGSAIVIEPAEFTITYMLPMAAPPLPHTMAIEISTVNGITKFDPVFARHVPLPAEARKTYNADHTLRPSDVEATLAVKFWEIEVSDDPQEKWWAGCVHLRADQIKRPILEGTPLELTIRIDHSRKMTVEVFVPALNQSFAENVYIPDPPSARSQVRQQLDACFDRLNYARSELYAADEPDLFPLLQSLEELAETIAVQLDAISQRRQADPDAASGMASEIRKLRMKIGALEERLGIGSAAPTLGRKLRGDAAYIERMVHAHGTDAEKAEFQRLSEQHERFRAADDARGLKWVHDAMWTVHSGIVYDAPWYWSDRLEHLQSPARRFVNQEQARELLARGQAARDRGDLDGIRSAVRSVWALLPRDQAQAARDQESASGLRME
ncbi:MAG TPA: Hsp70 family protein [Tepidisphaeraceae bacterium]|jgi:molecular chaperone DnaK|nr:Hsp70 family protein [Tepidisphaeraceae bacterium]